MQNPLSKYWRAVIIIQIMLTAVVSCLTGCGKSSNPYAALAKLYQPSPDTDVSALPENNFASFAGTVWKTKIRLVISNEKRYTGAPEIMLLAPRHFDPTDPDYIVSAHGPDVIAVLPAGTRVQIDRLMKDNGAWGALMVTATVSSGTNSWKNVILDQLLLANNWFIPRARTTVTNWDVSVDMLAPGGDSSQAASSAPKIDDTPQAGYKRGYANGKATAISVRDIHPGPYLSDPWAGAPTRPVAVELYGEDYVAAYESGYREGLHDNFKQN